MANTEASMVNPVVLITGGSGFLGKAIAKELLDSSSLIKPKKVRIFDLMPYDGIVHDKINYIEGDIQNYDEVIAAFKSVDIVIHTASIIDWGTREEKEVLSVNVGGTENVIKACVENNVQNLVYTSSLDAVYTGSPLVNIDENQKYPAVHQTSYCKSKYLGEKLVIEANSDELKTCVLRPSDIYGEGDPYHIDPLIDMAKSGFYIRLGNGKSKCQHVYVGNMAHAHVLAANALLQNNKSVFGKVYFITDGHGVNFFTFFDKIVLSAGYHIRPRNLWLPKWLAYPMASLTEFVALLISPIKKYNVKFSRFAVTYTCTDFTFNSDKAKADFNFIPKYTVDEATTLTALYYKKPD